MEGVRILEIGHLRRLQEFVLDHSVSTFAVQEELRVVRVDGNEVALPDDRASDVLAREDVVVLEFQLVADLYLIHHILF